MFGFKTLNRLVVAIEENNKLRAELNHLYAKDLRLFEDGTYTNALVRQGTIDQITATVDSMDERLKTAEFNVKMLVDKPVEPKRGRKVVEVKA